MNGVTHYLDLSNLYGSSTEKMNTLRGTGGYMKTFTDYGRELPPVTSRHECQIQKDGAACFESGNPVQYTMKFENNKILIPKNG